MGFAVASGSQSLDYGDVLLKVEFADPEEVLTLDFSKLECWRLRSATDAIPLPNPEPRLCVSISSCLLLTAERALALSGLVSGNAKMIEMKSGWASGLSSEFQNARESRTELPNPVGMDVSIIRETGWQVRR
jgi:hypothetical protein